MSFGVRMGLAKRADGLGGERAIQADDPGVNTDGTRYSLRQLRRNPCRAVVAVLTLEFGTGANTANFRVAPAAPALLPVHWD